MSARVTVNFHAKWVWLALGIIFILIAVAPVISSYYPATTQTGSPSTPSATTQTSQSPPSNGNSSAVTTQTSSGSAPPSGGGPAVNCANPCKIVITNSLFGNTQPTVVKVGTKVTWVNQDDTVHTSTSDIIGLWNSGIIAIGASFSTTFNKPGTFTYHCNVHPMTGTIVVVS